MNQDWRNCWRLECHGKLIYRASDLNSRSLLHKGSLHEGGNCQAKENIKDNAIYLALWEKVIVVYGATQGGLRGDHRVDSDDVAKQYYDYKLLSDATCTTMESFLHLVDEQSLHASTN